MARDIEEFLRRAAERRQQQKSQQGQPAPQQRQPPRRPVEPIEEVEVEIIEPTIVNRPAPRPKQDVEKPIAREKLRSEMRTESVSQHVERHINTNRISEKSKKLGQRVTSVHDQVDERVHQHLDHDISVIDDKDTITDDVRPGVVGSDKSKIAGDLLQFLSNPKSIRQAIIIAEILKRPDFGDDD